MTAHCTCHRAWTSLAEAHCTVCHAHFGSVTAFDRHGVNRNGCPDPATLRDASGNPVLRLVDRASGPTWITWASDEKRKATREAFARKAREASDA